VSTSGADARDTEKASQEVHEFACDLALGAGEIQLSRYERPGEVREKAPKDLVTEVDLLCEEFLISRINERYPEDTVLSEERGGEISASGRTWLLDPVDGTANFSRANPMFCVCISVVEDGAVTHAAVGAPRIGDLYHARLGGGAFRDSGGERAPMRVSDTRKLEYSFVGADLSFAPKKGPYREGLGKLFEDSWQLRAIGSAGIRGAWVAAGYLDLSVGTRNTVWDYAPTALLVSEAGGLATDLDGEPWSLDSYGLLAANPGVHAEALRVLSNPVE
jgi:myo-inositol-1(or 4)-monophosphatase